jgi:hypothetical protein
VTTIRQAHDEVIKSLVDQGKLIEGGFAAYRAVMLPPEVSDGAVKIARMTYMSGAQHLFASIISALDPDKDPTAADLDRMSKISDELQTFVGELELYLARRGTSQ